MTLSGTRTRCNFFFRGRGSSQPACSNWFWRRGAYLSFAPSKKVSSCQGSTEQRRLYKSHAVTSLHHGRQAPDHNIHSMASRRVEMALRSLGRRPLTCLYCQTRRSLTSSALRAARPEKPAAGTSLDPKSDIAGPAIEAPRSYGKKFQGEFTPQPLPRPIGMPLPPRPGENTGVDTRTREQRKKDFSDYDKHLERRKELYVHDEIRIQTQY